MKKDSIKMELKRRNKETQDILLNTPQETKLNHTMVGITNRRQQKPALYNPHNYRLYFSFSKQGFKPVEGMVGVWFGKLKNYGKEFTTIGEGIRVIIHKTQAEVINKLSDEQWFSINRARSKEEISSVLNKIDEKCVSSFRKFIEIYGGSSDFTILKIEGRPDLNLFNKCDNKVMKESFIDSLPLNMSFETPIVKKVYKKPNVEFKQPIYAANYLENSALKEFSPEIVEQLKAMYFISKEHKAAFEEYAKNIKLHLDVLNKIDKSINKLSSKIGQMSAVKHPLFSPQYPCSAAGSLQSRLTRWF